MPAEFDQQLSPNARTTTGTERQTREAFEPKDDSDSYDPTINTFTRPDVTLKLTKSFLDAKRILGSRPNDNPGEGF